MIFILIKLKNEFYFEEQIVIKEMIIMIITINWNNNDKINKKLKNK